MCTCEPILFIGAEARKNFVQKAFGFSWTNLMVSMGYRQYYPGQLAGPVLGHPHTRSAAYFYGKSDTPSHSEANPNVRFVLDTF